MCNLQDLRAFIRDRLIAAADEIFGAVERTVAEYKEEVSTTQGFDNNNSQQLQNVLTPQMEFCLLELQQECEQERNPCLDQEDPESTTVKQEQQELCISQKKTCNRLEVVEDAKGFRLSTFVKTEVQDQTRSNTAVFGDCLGTSEEQTQTLIDKTTLPYHIYGDHVGKNRNVEDHESILTEEDPYKCTGRSKTFTDPGLQQFHMGPYRKKTHRCTVCPKTFTAKSLLERHMRTHTGEKPFHCNICTFSSSQKGHLLLHMRTHTGEKPFHCKICPFRCSQKGHLIIHMRAHTGEKPYTCTPCGKGFTQSSSLRAHMKVHLGEKTRNRVHFEMQ